MGMLVRKLMILALISVPPALAGPMFGDEVAECLVSRGIKSGSPQFASEMEICEKKVEQSRNLDSARDTWQRCVMQEVSLLDDRVSPASDIGFAVQQECRQEYGKMLDSLAISPQARYMAEQNRADSTRELATRFTLIRRASARAPASAPLPPPTPRKK